MSDVTFAQINDKIQKHLTERDWQSNAPRSLAISIALEAAELLEHYQWDDVPVGDTDDLGSELADILIYIFQLAHQYDIDLPTAITDKLTKAAKKYPAKNFKGKNLKERNEAWYKDKLAHKKAGL